MVSYNIWIAERLLQSFVDRRIRPSPDALKPHTHPWLPHTNTCHCDLLSSTLPFFWLIKTMGFNKDVSHTNTHTVTIIRACLTATSQSTQGPCWHETAWGMGRSEVYDCADVNDIIQILNQAACLQSGSSPLAMSLENLAWIPAVKLSKCCTLERSRQKVTAQICWGCLSAGSWASARPHTCVFISSTGSGILPNLPNLPK